MIYKLYALPTLQTVEYLDSVFQGSPIPIDPQIFGVELGSSRTEVGPYPDAVYRAMPALMDVWYDTATQRSFWILPLIPSPEMVDRHDQVGDAWNRQFVPFVRVAEVQNMRRRNVAWLRSIATGLASTKPILTFTNEFVAVDDSIMPAQNDFYEDYLRRGLMSNAVFSDILSED